MRGIKEPTIIREVKFLYQGQEHSIDLPEEVEIKKFGGKVIIHLRLPLADVLPI